MKRILLLCTVILVTLVLIPACKRAEFQVGDLLISPNPVVAGEIASVGVEVTNIGDVPGTYTATLRIDGVEAQEKAVPVAAGGTEVVSFAVVEDVLGIYNLEINGASGTLKVVKPAEFRISDLVIMPSEPIVWETAKLQATVANVGDVEGSHTVTLLIDGAEIERKDITLAPGATETVSFDLLKQVAGVYKVQIDGVSETLVVREIGPEKLEEIKYDIEDEITLKNEGPGVVSRMVLRVALITTREPYQRVVSTNIRPDDYKTIEDEYGNTFAEFEFSDIGSGKEVSVKIIYRVAVSELRYHLGPCEGPVPARFLESEPWIECDAEEIVALAKQLTKDKLSPCEKARAIYDWIGDNISYTGPSVENRGALFALRNRGGDCTEFSDLLIALCRAAGIPARYLNGVVLESPSPAAEMHSRAEIYLAGTGWVPVDATWGRFKDRRAQYFASMTADYIMVHKGRSLDVLGGGAWFYCHYWWKEQKTEVSPVQSWQIRRID